MLTHAQRLDEARASITYICGRAPAQLELAVPNCPGWTVYNAAVHIGKVGVAWHAMISAQPDDPESRTRGYLDAENRGSGHSVAVLERWALGAIDLLDDDVERPCYFSMTGGHGTVGLWGWHVASELGVHRLDIEAALGEPHALTPAAAADAIDYTCQYFLPAMRRATNVDPGALVIAALDESGATVATPTISSEGSASAKLRGPAVDLLLALWGRPHRQLDVEGDASVIAQWQALPGQAFQFGTWD